MGIIQMKPCALPKAIAKTQLTTNKEDTPVEMDIHEFCERCEEMMNEENIRFMVFPTDKDAWIVSTEGLLNDLTEELERVE